MRLTDSVLDPSAFLISTFIMLEPLQMISVDCGLISGDAMAAPSDRANHTSMKRVIRCIERRVCSNCAEAMATILGELLVNTPTAETHIAALESWAQSHLLAAFSDINITYNLENFLCLPNFQHAFAPSPWCS